MLNFIISAQDGLGDDNLFQLKSADMHTTEKCDTGLAENSKVNIALMMLP